MKQLVIQLDNEVHHRIKVAAVMNGISMQSLVSGLVLTGLPSYEQHASNEKTAQHFSEPNNF